MEVLTDVSGQHSVSSVRKSLPTLRNKYRSHPQGSPYRRFGTSIGPIHKEVLTDVSEQLSVSSLRKSLPTFRNDYRSHPQGSHHQRFRTTIGSIPKGNLTGVSGQLGPILKEVLTDVSGQLSVPSSRKSLPTFRNN